MARSGLIFSNGCSRLFQVPGIVKTSTSCHVAMFHFSRVFKAMLCMYCTCKPSNSQEKEIHNYTDSKPQ